MHNDYEQSPAGAFMTAVNFRTVFRLLEKKREEIIRGYCTAVQDRSRI